VVEDDNGVVAWRRMEKELMSAVVVVCCVFLCVVFVDCGVGDDGTKHIVAGGNCRIEPSNKMRASGRILDDMMFFSSSF
jgi:hypothetical protein